MFLKGKTETLISIAIGSGRTIDCRCSRLVSVGSIQKSERFDSRCVITKECKCKTNINRLSCFVGIYHLLQTVDDAVDWAAGLINSPQKRSKAFVGERGEIAGS